MKRKIGNLNLIFFLLFLILFFFCFYLQVIKGEYFKTRAEKNRIRLIPHPTSRGMIFDRNKKVLATNIPRFSISIIQEGLSEKEIKNSLFLISSLIDIDKEKAYKAIRKKSLRPFEPAEIIGNISKDDALKIASRAFFLPGLIIQAEPARYYPDGHLAAHLLGYIGPITKEELKEKRGYLVNDKLGKSGIERSYENLLKGKGGGDIIETDVSGRTIRVLGKQEATPGCNLYLTIDKALQEVGEKALYKKNGVIIALCPKTGEILALVSKPSFDPNMFLKHLSKKDVREIITNPFYPLANRAIQFRYPPGSLFKIIDAYLGLEHGIIKGDEYIKCMGKFKVGNKNFFCFKHKHHGDVNIISAIALSCNIYFYQLGLKIGEKRLMEGAKLFGLSDKTGVDLPYEIKGKVPSASWKERIFKTRWFAGDTINLSIGQGYVLTTPLEMALAMCGIANGGNIFKPYIVKYIEYPNGKIIMKIPVLKKRIKMKEKTKSILDRALEKVVISGTGRGAYIPGIRIAGKTGTAQNPHGKDHAWFVCYAPVDNPKIVVAVLVEHGGQGGIEAAPIARRILEGFFGIKKVEIKTQTETETQEETTDTREQTMDNQLEETESIIQNQQEVNERANSY